MSNDEDTFGYNLKNLGGIGRLTRVDADLLRKEKRDNPPNFDPKVVTIKKISELIEVTKNGDPKARRLALIGIVVAILALFVSALSFLHQLGWLTIVGAIIFNAPAG